MNPRESQTTPTSKPDCEDSKTRSVPASTELAHTINPDDTMITKTVIPPEPAKPFQPRKTHAVVQNLADLTPEQVKAIEKRMLPLHADLPESK